ncbi:hypothetical protein [Paraburkholderia rhizosphaerae]|uniref:Uncharacterized protein n=1 Tax=Paraburkholderia rhizosphaerae TaxID=480658 RepID=A0A4V3HEJ4_9BURK|nr:hypothetical protein [Paraburkholderia rhizosphaerae]TDY48089.1 hypothetical protein BX592_11122 [Paraburkholderia rhizosphaerae]
MDLREIQSLHAQYASQPVTIDIAGQVAAMPALPAPADRGDRRATSGITRRIARPVLIGLGVGALAVGAALGGLHLFQVIHTSAPVHASLHTDPAPHRPAGLQDMPVNVAPARPLTDRDFIGASNAPPSAMSSVDVRALSAAPAPRATEQRAAATSQAELATAAASPIHAPRTAVAAVAPAAEGIATPATAATVTQPMVTRNAPEVAASAVPSIPATKPIQKPIHHPVHHRTVEPPDASSESTALPAGTGTKPANPVGKSGDVQLF